MRKWRAVLLMGALAAIPLSAQEAKNDKDAAGTSLWPASAPAKTAALASRAEAAPRNAWGLAGAPRTTPFATPKAAGGDQLGRLTPRWEVAATYTYIKMRPGGAFDSFDAHGATAGFAYNVSRSVGLVADLGGGRFSRTLSPSDVRHGGLFTYLFGPRLSLRKSDRLVPFAEFLGGGSRSGGGFVGLPSSGHDSFVLAAGGGLDVVLTPSVAWRVAQVDYLPTWFSGPLLGGSRQDNFRLGSGLVFRIGNRQPPPPPPPPNRPPVASCAASPSSVYAGSGDVVAIHVNASDPDNDPLTYSYSATGGSVTGTGPDARWNSAGVAVGTYTVAAKVDDGKGGTASCSADIKLETRPNRPPTISCTTERSPILVGEHTKINCTASDPDGDPLSYSCTTTGGKVSGSGPVFDFDSTGASAGSYKVTCTVNDGRGGTADSSTTVDVQAPPPPPQASKIGDCSYKPGITRVDNVCKRVGDDVALRLKNDANAKAVIVGFADPKEKGVKLGATRAELFKKYLGEKGIDASRISTRTGEAQKAADQQNRRIDIIFVPEGATF